MKKTPAKRSRVSENRVAARDSDEMRPHYDFDYSKARPNRFSEKFQQETVAVVLDADVADVFDSSESVNAVLRSAIRAMRTTGAKNTKRITKRRAS